MRTSQLTKLAPLPLALVVLMHAGVLAAIMALRPAAVPPSMPAMMVDLIASERQERKVEQPAPTKPPAVVRQVRPQPVVAEPVLTTQSPAAPDAVEAPQITAPTPAVQSAPAPQLEQLAQSAPVVAPRFDADYLENPSPVYPPLSRRGNEQGKVVLRVFVEASGAPGQVDVRTSSGFERLDRSAVAAVKRWKFIPARQGHKAVPDWVEVPIIFSLNG